MNNNTVNTRFLALVTITATLGGLLFGYDTAVISGTISFVKDQYNMSPLMEGWYVSSALLGSIGGVAISGELGNRLGRKKTMLLSAVLFTLCAIGCAFAPDAFVLIVFRLAGGIGIGVASVICPMYIAELALPRLRGKLVSFYQLAITVGILLAYFFNAVIQKKSAGLTPVPGWMHLIFRQEVWRGMFAIATIPAFVFLFMILLIPESPRWLALKNRNSAAEKILAKISNADYAKEEMKSIRNSFRTVSDVTVAGFFKGNFKKPLIIGIFLAALSQFSGINAIIYYGPSILEKAGFKFGEALGGQVMIGVVSMLFTFVAIYFIDKIGRKPLLLWGIGGSVISLLLTGFLFAIHISGGWPVLSCIILFIACFSFSVGPVTWVVIAEIFPTKIRSKAIALSTMALWLANWIVGQFFPLLLLKAGASFTFLVFAVFSSFAFYLSWKKIPETKGRSLEEIEAFWTLNKMNIT